MRRALTIMAKVPKPGRVKTRMCPPLTFEQAAELYGAFLSDVLDVAESARAECACEVWLLVAADDARELEAAARAWPSHVNLRIQQGRGLGSRILHAHRAPRADATVVIGSDSPQMNPKRIASAFDAIGRGYLVVGPVVDGGYDLIGGRVLPEVLVSDSIPWSTNQVLPATRGAAQAVGARLFELDVAADIDEVADLRRALSEAPLAALRYTRPVATRILRSLPDAEPGD